MSSRIAALNASNHVDHALHAGEVRLFALNAIATQIVRTPPPPPWFEQEPDYLLDTMTADLDVSHGAPVAFGATHGEALAVSAAMAFVLWLSGELAAL